MQIRSLPGYGFVRRIGTAFLTPVKFSIKTGHFKSSIARRSLDAAGRPIPWYTFSAIDFLSNVDFSEQAILEFGGGQSTFWWAQRAASVFSIDDNPAWFNYVNAKVQKLPNVEFYLCEDMAEYAKKPLGRRFDLIIIDGGDRLLCAGTALEVINEGGAVMLDNSEGYWGGDEQKSYPIVELFQRAGFMRVDFYGFAPGVIKPHCTSIFFKDRARIFENLKPPVRK